MSQGPTTYQRLSPDGVRGQQVMVDPQQRSGRSQIKPREKFKKVLYGLGVTEVVLGCLSLVLSIATLAYVVAHRGNHRYPWHRAKRFSYVPYYYTLTNSAQGLWGGVFLVVTGILGIRARKTPSGCMYNANMALSIITANVMGVDVILSSIAAARTRYINVLIAIHAILAVIAFAGMIISIIHSAYCCAGTCCRSKQFQGTVMYVPQQYIQQPQQQMVQLANGQYMMVPSQPMMAQGYPGAPAPMVGTPMAFQPTQASGVVPQMTMPPVAAPSTALPHQPVQSAKNQEAQMEAAMVRPPGYSTLPHTQNPTA